MGIVSDAAVAAGGDVTGITPYAIVAAGGEGPKAKRATQALALLQDPGREKVCPASVSAPAAPLTPARRSKW
jgi:hypothetical protein